MVLAFNFIVAYLIYAEAAVLFAFLTCLPAYLGYPSGPPQSVCATMMPDHGVDHEDSEPPYTVTLSGDSYAKGSDMTVTITATDMSMPFKGFFIQARDPAKLDALGAFSIDSDPQIHLVACPNNDSSTNGVVHSSNVDKTSKTFTWKNSDALVGSELVFKATIVYNKTIFWTDVNSNYIKVTVGAGAMTKSNIMIVSLLIATFKMLV